MKYFLTIFLAGFIALSFMDNKCDHVFTEVEQANIKIEQPDLFLGGTVYRPYSWPTGKQEGKELICVKCFHKQKQVLDYGEPIGSRALSYRSACDTSFFIGSGNLIFDSVITLSKGGSAMINAGPWVPPSKIN